MVAADRAQHGRVGRLRGSLDEAEELAGQHADKVENAIDRAAGVADEKTGGKYAEHIDKGAEAAGGFVGDESGDAPPPPAVP